jgi:hypothetical protein
MTLEESIREKIEGISKYGFPEKDVWHFAHLGYCITHNFWFSCMKRHIVETDNYNHAFRLETLIEFKDTSHFKLECNAITNTQELIGAYMVLEELLEEIEQK